MNTLGSRLKKLREEKDNISQAELAKILNVSQSTVAYYETNKKTPPIDMLAKLANFFNCSTDYLIGKEEYIARSEINKLINTTTNNDRKQQLQEISNLPSEEFNLLYKIAKSSQLQGNENFLKHFFSLPEKEQEKIKAAISIFIPEK